MDSLTHIVLGACIGEVMLEKKIGKRALFLGALAQSVPDIDFIATSWLSISEDLLAHRGFTHSFLFGLLITPILAWLADRWRRPHDVTYREWLLFFGTEIMAHLLLDAANAYGTGWFEPFDHVRFSYHLLFVADPLFSVVPGIVFVFLLFFKSKRQRMLGARFSIIWCCCYLLLSVVNKSIVERSVKSIASRQNITYDRYFTTPTPMNNLLWYVVLEDSAGFHIGYRSVFDTRPNMDFRYFPQNDTLLADVPHENDLAHLLRFSQGFYTIEQWGDTLVWNDLRFGQQIGWKNRDARFAFYYFLQQPDNNKLIVQRGRFAGWNKEVVVDLWRRMLGE